MLYAVAADLASPLGPDGPPSNLDYYLYNGPDVAYTWTSYSAAYETQVSLDGGSTVSYTAGPGVEVWESEISGFDSGYAVRHKHGGLFSAWAAYTS